MELGKAANMHDFSKTTGVVVKRNKKNGNRHVLVPAQESEIQPVD